MAAARPSGPPRNTRSRTAATGLPHERQLPGCAQARAQRTLWYVRHHYLVRILAAGLANPMLLDADIAVQASPYPLLEQPPLARHQLIFALDHLPRCESWPGLIVKYITDDSVGAFSRVKRPDKPADELASPNGARLACILTGKGD